MVLLKATLAGAVLVVVGVVLLTVAGPYITVQGQVVQRHDLEPHAEFLVGDVVDRQYSLPASVSVFGVVNVGQAPSNQSGSLQFIVLDAQNYQLWATGEQSNNVYSSDQQGISNFTFSTGGAGVYHFIFDNRASVYKKYVTISVSYNEVSISNKPDPRVPYAGWAILSLGIVVLAYGLARKPAIPWA